MLQNCAGRRTQNRIFDPLAGCAWIAWRRRRDVAGLITVYDRMTTCGQGAFYERSPKLFTRGSAEAARYPRLNVTAQFLLIRVIRVVAAIPPRDSETGRSWAASCISLLARRRSHE